MNYPSDYIKIDRDLPQKLLQSRFLLLCVICLLLLKVFTIAAYINFSANIFFADITETALLNFANETRSSLGLKPLIENTKLDQAAQLKAVDMVQKQYFSHTSPQGITPWYWFQKIGYNYKYAGENLAIGFFDSKEVYDAWLNSPSHRENLLNPNYKEIGTAVLDGFGQNNAVVVVQLFGSQRVAKVAANPNNPKNTVEQPINNTQVQQVPKEPNEQNGQKEVTLNEKPEVLSQSIESFNSFEAPKGSTSDDLHSRFLNLAIYNYDDIIGDIVYGFLLIIMGTLLTAIFFNLDKPIKKQFILRSAILIILLVVTALINKEIIVSIIPHQVII